MLLVGFKPAAAIVVVDDASVVAGVGAGIVVVVVVIGALALTDKLLSAAVMPPDVPAAPLGVVRFAGVCSESTIACSTISNLDMRRFPSTTTSSVVSEFTRRAASPFEAPESAVTLAARFVPNNFIK